MVCCGYVLWGFDDDDDDDDETPVNTKPMVNLDDTANNNNTYLAKLAGSIFMPL